MQKIIKLKDFIVTILLFIIMYRPEIFGFSANYYLVLILLIMMIFNKRIKIEKSFLIDILIPLLFVIIYVLIAVFYNKGSSEVLVSLANLVISFVVVMELFCLPFSRRIMKTKLLDLITKIGIFQSTMCIMMKISPAIYNILSIEETYITSLDYSRNYGIAGSSEYLFGIGLVHGFLSLIIFSKFLDEKKLKYLMMTMVLLVPCVLDTRTGLLCFFAGAIVLVFSLKKPLHLLTRYIYLVPVFSGLIVVYFKMIKNNKFISQFIEAVMSLLLNKSNTKVYEWYGGLLPRNWILPNGIELLFGTGKFDTNNTYIVSGVHDSGYYRMIYIGGIILIAISLIILLRYLCIAKLNKSLKYAMATFVLLAEVKGNAFVMCSFMCVFVCIIEYLNDNYAAIKTFNSAENN